MGPHPAVEDAAAEHRAAYLADARRGKLRLRPVPPTGEGFLTEGEMECMDHLSAAARAWFTEVEHPGPQADLDEFAAAIHVLQARVMARAASRLYPDRFRQL